MNVLTVSGRVGKDAVTRYTKQTNNAVTGFSVAVRVGYGQNESTLWLNCNLWGKLGESLADYLVKGQEVVVSGELSEREWQNDNGETKKSLEVKVREVTLVGGKPETTAAPQQQRQAPQQKAPQQPPSDFPVDDDIPF